MENIDKHYDFEELIARYLAGDCSDEEAKKLEQWVKASEENKKIFNEMKKAITLASLPNPISTEIDKHWQEVESRINPKVSLQRKERKVRRQFPYRWSIAAAIALLFGLAFYFTKMKQGSEHKIITAQNEIQDITLPDGSTVYLNAGSVIRFPKKFALIRKIELSGTAFFKVQRDEKHPFVIQANEAQVQVLGTSFLVKSSKQKTEVIVKTGKVSLSNSKKEKLILTKGEHGVLQSNQLHKKQNRDRNFMAWKTKDLLFDNDSLAYVISKINEVYKAKIQLKDDNIGKCSLSAHFKDENLNDNLTVITTTLNLESHQEGKLILLDGKSCLE